MAETDGSIKLAVGLEAADVKRSASQLQAEIARIFETSAGKKMSKQFDQVSSTMSRLSAQAEKLKLGMEKLENTRIPTDEYKQLDKELEKTMNQIGSLNDKLANLETSKRRGVSAMKESIKEQLKDLEEQYREITKEMNSMKEGGTAYISGADTSQYKNMQDQLANVNNQMRLITNKANELAAPAKKSSRAFESVREAVSKVAEGIKKVASQLAKLSVSAVKKLANGFVTVGKKVGNVAKKIMGIGPHLDAHQLNVKKLVRQVLKYGLGIRSVFILWRKLRGYATNALKEMAKQFDDVDIKISGIVNSFNQFKNSIGTIVEPLLNLFGPAIEKIIQGMTAMSNKIANFVAVFTGQEYIYKATKSNKRYSQSLKETADAAKEANEQLGDYDELLVIQQQSQSSTDSSQGSEPLFEKVAVQPSGFAQSIKDAISGGDWSKVGKDLATKLNESISGINANGIASTIADKINNATSLVASFLTTFSFTGLGEKIGGALSTFLTRLNWENIAVSVGASIKGKADFIASFFETVDWEGATSNLIAGLQRVNWREVASSIVQALKKALSAGVKVVNTVTKEIDGKKIGEGVGDTFNEVVTSTNELIEEVNWDDLGVMIGGFVAGALDRVEWGTLFQTIGNLSIHLFDATSLAIQQVQWTDLGIDFYDGFGEVPWDEVADAVFYGIGTALGGLVMFVGGIVWSAMADIGTYFEKQIQDAGGNIAEGLLYGIADVLSNIWNWIVEHIFNPFIEALCDIFGIASPSKEMEEYGGYVADGFLAAFDDLAELFGEIWDGLVEIVKAPINLIIGFINTMIGAVEKAINFVIKGLNKLSFDVPDWIPVIGGETWGFNISPLILPRIPELAQGAVIPPNREFLALLGDQKQGTNIEAPLDTIVEAFNMALNSRTDTRQAAPIVLQLNGRTVAQAVWDEEEKRYRQTGSYRPNFA